MKTFFELTSEEIYLICDYLTNPSSGKNGKEGSANDRERRKRLYDIGIHKRTDKNESNNKFLTGPLGEGIVRIYYEKLKVSYDSSPENPSYTNRVGENKRLMPDGVIFGPPKIWVESKMRAYYSSGTANEKIPNVPRKYKPIGGKLILFLMADDEHTFNKEWSQICRGDIEPLDEIEENWRKADTAVLEQIIYGTEVANILAS
tara:strand:- start:321 stop:929 length:609 start_codon:yes stop_codon:yes gene_type:complete